MATSRSIGSDLSFSSTFGAHSLSSSRLASCKVYWNCVRAMPAADVDVLRGLHEEARALDLLQLRPQPRDHLPGRDVALALGLQRDEEAAVVERRRGAAGADRHGVGGDCRILADDLAERLLAAHHLGEGDVLPGLRNAGDEAGILLREEALGDADEQVDR